MPPVEDEDRSQKEGPSQRRVADEQGRGGIEARLGYNTWLHSLPMRRDADEAIFSLKEF